MSDQNDSNDIPSQLVPGGGAAEPDAEPTPSNLVPGGSPEDGEPAGPPRESEISEPAPQKAEEIPAPDPTPTPAPPEPEDEFDPAAFGDDAAGFTEEDKQLLAGEGGGAPAQGGQDFEARVQQEVERRMGVQSPPAEQPYTPHRAPLPATPSAPQEQKWDAASVRQRAMDTVASRMGQIPAQHDADGMPNPAYERWAGAYEMTFEHMNAEAESHRYAERFQRESSGLVQAHVEMKSEISAYRLMKSGDPDDYADTLAREFYAKATNAGKWLTQHEQDHLSKVVRARLKQRESMRWANLGRLNPAAAKKRAAITASRRKAENRPVPGGRAAPAAAASGLPKRLPSMSDEAAWERLMESGPPITH